ncbi:MAG: adenine phosphoribosyltransferase [Thaumarchaeota archaeon]|nr:adenine phosphoribosyltransferase [Nitrososphaerota archaeon]
MDLKKKIRNIKDFPKKGIIFRDITPILKDPEAFSYVTERFAKEFPPRNYDLVAGIESRGFIFGAALAVKMGKGLVIVRKQGKLPGDTIAKSYDIEYGSATMEIQTDAVKKGDRVLIIDDLLATGGTAQAAAALVEKLGGKVVGMGFVIELVALDGKKKLSKYNMKTLVRYS